MVVHIVLFCSIIIASIKIKGKYLYPISFILLFIIAAIRYEYGNDYIHYFKQYQLIRSGEKSPYGIEHLYTILNKISPNFFWVICFTTFIFIFVHYVFVRDNVPDNIAWVSVMIYVLNPYIYLVNLSSIRQSVALSLFIIAIGYSIKRRFIPYLLCILIGTLFHQSAIALLPIYFIANDRKISNKFLLFVVIVIFALLFSQNLIFSILELILPLFNNLNYVYYANEGSTNSLRATLLSSVYLIYVLVNVGKMEGKALVYSKLYLISCILVVLSYKLSMLTRLQMYFDTFSIVSLPLIWISSKSFTYSERRWGKVIRIINLYALPGLIMVIYLLRYYSFFTNPLWEPFFTYDTICGVH